MNLYKLIIKRVFDFSLSLIVIIILSPIFLIISLLVAIKLGCPIFFCQERPGKNEMIFKMYKFRTMTDKKNQFGNLLPDADRLTSFGKKLRATSLDELPELFNILKGDMSIVGPRPLLVQYLPLYNKQQKRRHLVRPGLTGWAQVNGRNKIPWKQRFELDVWYVDNVSIFLDVKIIFKTILKVINRSDINSDNDETMEDFRGE